MNGCHAKRQARIGGTRSLSGARAGSRRGPGAWRPARVLRPPRARRSSRSSPRRRSPSQPGAARARTSSNDAGFSFYFSFPLLCFLSPSPPASSPATAPGDGPRRAQLHAKGSASGRLGMGCAEPRPPLRRCLSALFLPSWPVFVGSPPSCSCLSLAVPRPPSSSASSYKFSSPSAPLLAPSPLLPLRPSRRALRPHAPEGCAWPRPCVEPSAVLAVLRCNPCVTLGAAPRGLSLFPFLSTSDA